MEGHAVVVHLPGAVLLSFEVADVAAADRLVVWGLEQLLGVFGWLSGVVGVWALLRPVWLGVGFSGDYFGEVVVAFVEVVALAAALVAFFEVEGLLVVFGEMGDLLVALDGNVGGAVDSVLRGVVAVVARVSVDRRDSAASADLFVVGGVVGGLLAVERVWRRKQVVWLVALGGRDFCGVDERPGFVEQLARVLRRPAASHAGSGGVQLGVGAEVDGLRYRAVFREALVLRVAVVGLRRLSFGAGRRDFVPLLLSHEFYESVACQFFALVFLVFDLEEAAVRAEAADPLNVGVGFPANGRLRAFGVVWPLGFCEVPAAVRRFQVVGDFQ